MFRELERNIKRNVDRDIIYYMGKNITNRELYGHIGAFAKRLQDLGVKSGDVVTIALPNIPEVVIAIYAVNKIGGICNMVHPKVPATKTIAAMKSCDSKIAILVDEFYLVQKTAFDSAGYKYIFAEIAGFLPKLKQVAYRFGNGVKDSNLKGASFFGDEKILDPSVIPTHKFERNAPAVYMHSSGTTGAPKTVVLSNENINFVAVNGIELLAGKETAGKNMLAVLPMFHGFGLCMSMHTPLVHNMGVALIPKFSPKEVVAAMKKTRVSVMCGVPKMYEKLVAFEGFANKDILQKLEIAFCGGDSLPEEIERSFNYIMQMAGSKAMLFEGYGLTESVAVCAVNTFKATKAHSCGKPIPGTRIKVVDKDMKEVARGELGEIIIAAPSIMKGYLEGGTAVEKGYLRTGDIGWIDEDGFLFFKQREKHVLNISGYNVYPSEICDTAMCHELVENCVVLKGEDTSGEFARLVVQPKDGVDFESLEIILRAYLKSHLESWSVPKEILIFQGDLPLTLVGKVDMIKLEKILTQENIK